MVMYHARPVTFDSLCCQFVNIFALHETNINMFTYNIYEYLSSFVMDIID